MTEEEWWERVGQELQCDQCPSAKRVGGVISCPFWVKRQLCPVELGMAEVPV